MAKTGCSQSILKEERPVLERASDDPNPDEDEEVGVLVRANTLLNTFPRKIRTPRNKTTIATSIP